MNTLWDYSEFNVTFCSYRLPLHTTLHIEGVYLSTVPSWCTVLSTYDYAGSIISQPGDVWYACNLIRHGHVRKWNGALKFPTVKSSGICRRIGPCCAEWKQIKLHRTRTCRAEFVGWGNTCRYSKQADQNINVTHNVTQRNLTNRTL
jgi:hypothetical protein